jgi:hypothetical protein
MNNQTPQTAVDLKLFRVDDGELWWIVAESPEAALEIAKESYDVPGDDDVDVAAYELHHDWSFTVFLTEGYDPEDKTSYPAPPQRSAEGEYWHVTATVREWIASSKRGDLLASSIW